MGMIYEMLLINHFHHGVRTLVLHPLDSIARFSSPIRVKQAVIQYCARKAGPTPTLVFIFWLDDWNAQCHLTAVVLSYGRRRENGL
jgi:hypothetical protein